MAKPILVIIATIACYVAIPYQLWGQDQEKPKFYIGAAFGTSFSIGDFRDTDISNPDAGFAKNGRRFDLFTGAPIDERGRITLTGVFRYQMFETEVEDIIETLKTDNPDLELVGSTDNWRAFSFLFGLGYRIDIGSKFSFIPRIGLGPMLASNPGMQIEAPNAVITNTFERSRHTGTGLGYEIGIGLRRDLGKHFSLLPTFTFSGGFVTIKDVVTSTDNVVVTSDYQPSIQSFNIGLSLGYRFY